MSSSSISGVEKSLIQANVVQELDPLTDFRWNRFVLTHPIASIFHTSAWLRCLQEVYEYVPIAFCVGVSDSSIQSALLSCIVNSRLSGKRLVSLPFSDHCEPLINDHNDLHKLICAATSWAKGQRCKYLELRPTSLLIENNYPFTSYYHHQIDLTGGSEEVFKRFHPDCVRRKLRRAAREELVLERGRSNELLNEFYVLHNRSRLRLGLFPQPIAWFESLLKEFKEQASIYLARHRGLPIASVFMLETGKTAVYKYGSSDPEFNSKGGMQLLLWTAIEEACNKGHKKFDLGRSDMGQTGLVDFKDRWGANKSIIHYYRFPDIAGHELLLTYLQGAIKQALIRMPEWVGPRLGNLLYRHLG